MFKLRRIISSGLIVAATSMLVACGSSDSTEQQATTAEAQVEAVRVGMSGSYFPFTYREGGELKGFEVDVWNEISNRIDRPVEFVTAPFSGLFGMLESSRIDTISNQITVTDERQQKYRFSTPYVFDGAQITVNKENRDINSLDDLKGRKVAVNLGSNFEQLLRNYDPKGEITVVTYDSGIEQDVAIGRSDAFIMDRLSAVELIKKSGLPLKITGQPFTVIANAMPFRKDASSDELRQQINITIEAMRADGTLAAISNQWFGIDVTEKAAAEENSSKS